MFTHIMLLFYLFNFNVLFDLIMCSSNLTYYKLNLQSSKMSKMIRLEWALFPLVLMFIERERKGYAYDAGFLLYLFSATFFNYSRILLAPRLD